MFDIRFHLGAGKHYKHWQIKSDNVPTYHDPAEGMLVLYGCTLKNERGKAERVFATQKRDVCGYVRCFDYISIPYDSVNTEDSITTEGHEELMYDPKIAPYWRSSNGPDNYDNLTYDTLVTVGRRVFVSPRKDFLKK
jgi:hypothetical protein